MCILCHITLDGQHQKSLSSFAKTNLEIKPTNEEKRKIFTCCKLIVLQKIQSEYSELMKAISNKLDTGCNAIRNIMLDYEYIGLEKMSNKNMMNQPTGTACIEINDFDKNAIRRMVHSFWFNRKLPTIEAILAAVNKDPSFAEINYTSLRTLLIDLHFEFTKINGNSIVMENRDLISWRRKYLTAIQQFRNEGRPIYYLGDTWANPGDYLNNIWLDKTDELYRMAFLEGFFLLNIGSDEGFLPGVGISCIESKTNPVKHNENIKGHLVQEWFGNVLPLLKDNAVIVVDNTPYYSVISETSPTINWEKNDIIQWLNDKGENIDPNKMEKIDLMAIVDRIKPQCNTYVIDEMAKSSNKTVLRVPRYHCELNPIQLIWSTIKNLVKTNSIYYDQPNLFQLIFIAINKITQEHWSSFISCVNDEEKMLLELESISDELMELELDLDKTDSKHISVTSSDIDIYELD